MAIYLSDDNFEKEVLESALPVMVDFYADWCAPCRMMSPLVEEIEEEYRDKIKVCKMNAGDFPKVPEKLKIMSLPTFALFLNGSMVKSIVGAVDKNTLLELAECCVNW